MPALKPDERPDDFEKRCEKAAEFLGFDTDVGDVEDHRERAFFRLLESDRDQLTECEYTALRRLCGLNVREEYEAQYFYDFPPQWLDVLETVDRCKAMHGLFAVGSGLEDWTSRTTLPFIDADTKDYLVNEGYVVNLYHGDRLKPSPAIFKHGVLEKPDIADDTVE